MRLWAIAPSFHKHNLIDRKYNLLKIDLLQVQVLKYDEQFQLKLQDIDDNQTWSIPIPYQELKFSSTSGDIPETPQLLLDWLGACTGEEQQAILKLREKILGFDERIKEEIEGRNTIRYGKGKSKPVAEICYQKSSRKLVVFLWLPTPTSWQREVIGRLRLWLDGEIVTYVGHISEGLGKMKPESEWLSMPREKRPGNHYHQKYSPFHAGVYNKFLQQDFKNIVYLQALVDLALTKWLARL